MFHQVRINAFFDNYGVALGLVQHAMGLTDNMKVINPGEPHQECSVIDYIENHHDEPPPHPCTELSHWDNSPSP